MDELQEEINEKVALIEDFIALSLRRVNVAEGAYEIMQEVCRVRDLMSMVNAAMQNELDNVQLEYEATMKRMRQQTSIVLVHLLKERRRKLQEAADAERHVQLPFSACKSAKNSALKVQCNGATSLLQSMEGLHLQNAQTPKITLSNYKESPMVKRCVINPIPFRFLDFDYRISPQQFEKIPKYMKGRESLDELNNFFETVIAMCFNQKYALLHRQRSSVRNRHDLELWKLYNEQASYVPGRYFITLGDISRQMQKMLDKKQQNRIVMLRHIGVLREQRVAQTVCYIWNVDALVENL